MYKKFQLSAFLLSALLILSSCALNPAPQRTVRLRGNQTKGYTWEYTAEKNEIINEVDRAYRDGNVPGTSDAPGLFVFTFEGAQEGSTRVYFHYIDPDEADGKPLSTIVYSVTVSADGDIMECRPIGTFLDVEGVETLEEILNGMNNDT